MPQGVYGDVLVEPGGGGRRPAGPVELAGGDGLAGIAAREQPALRPPLLPPAAQEVEQIGSEHHVAVLTPLALLDADLLW